MLATETSTADPNQAEDIFSKSADTLACWKDYRTLLLVGVARQDDIHQGHGIRFIIAPNIGGHTALQTRLLPWGGRRPPRPPAWGAGPPGPPLRASAHGTTGKGP